MKVLLHEDQRLNVQTWPGEAVKARVQTEQLAPAPQPPVKKQRVGAKTKAKSAGDINTMWGN